MAKKEKWVNFVKKLGVGTLLKEALLEHMADFPIEEGSNYTKWLSGKLECWGSASLAGANEGNSRTIGYPVSFVGAKPRVFTQLYRNAATLGVNVTIVVDESASTGNGFSVFHTSTAGIAVLCHWEAKGRWK